MAEITNKAWEEFVRWCQSRNLRAVPANPWTLAAYIRSCEERYSFKAIEKRVEGINKVHAAKTRKRLDHHPLVLRTLKMIENRGQSRQQNAGLFEDDDFVADQPRVKKTRQPAKSRKASKPKTGLVLGSTPRLVTRRRLKR